jgi:hypothetical protein
MRSGLKGILLAVGAGALMAACGGPPRESYVQWVARDAWDPSCAEQAIIETWKQDNGRWKVKGEVWTVDVEAGFKLVNKCDSGLPLAGKSYKQFEVVPFQGTIEMSKCKKDGDTGWALPGKESSRCWTGPTLLPQGS